MRALIWVAVSTTVQGGDDKISLPEQESAARALCDREQWTVIDTLLVPGHSRRYINIFELASAARERNIDAFDKLLRHFEARDFDVLICRDSERFARTQSLHAYIVESVIQIGARVYSLVDGWIDERNYRMFISMAGYKAASDIDRLVASRRKAMDARAARGLPTSSSIIPSHTLVRDERGKPVRLIVNEAMRSVFEDAASLLLEGVGWRDIEQQLYRRFGHVNAKGSPFARLTMYDYFHNPMFWGHSARFWRDSKFKNGARTDMWVFDAAEPIPEGVKMFRDTHPPVLTGELAQRVMSELRRRRMAIRGSARPQRTRPFSGLVVCGRCGYYMVYHGNKGYPGYKCVSRHWRSEQRTDCDNRLSMQEAPLRAWIDARLREMLAAGDPTYLLSSDADDGATTPAQRLAVIERDIDDAEAQLRTMILKQASAPATTVAIYDQEIEKLASRLQILKDSLAQAQSAAQRQRHNLGSMTDAYHELAELSIDLLWQQSGTYINQLLHRLFGNRRLVSVGGQIVGSADAPPVRRRN